MTTEKKQSKFQSEIRLIHRSEIKNAPYNPRIQSDKAKTEVRKNIKKHGLMSSLTWNETTGNLVGGHLRLAQMDILEKKAAGNYYLSVSVVHLTEKEEKEQNIFLNSTTVQGQFDFDALNLMLEEIDPFAAGLDEYDLNVIGYSEMEDEISENEKEQVSELEKITKKTKVKEAKKRYEEDLANRYEDEGVSYITLSFSDVDAKKRFMRKYGLNSDDLFIKGELFIKLLKEYSDAEKD